MVEWSTTQTAFSPLTRRPLLLFHLRSGFVGSHIVSLLLSDGYGVHATVRQQQAFDDLAATFDSDRLRVFVIPELTTPGALDEAISECRYAVHVASTVPTKDAISGVSISSTVGCIESVMKAASKHRCAKVVLTSSMSTHLDSQASVLNEKTWYTPDLPSAKLFVQYMSAKTLAERRAWELSSNLGLPLTTVAPVYVGGPTILRGQGPKSPLSNQDLLRYMEDESKSKIPGWIDVRTVAQLHLFAIEAEELEG